MNTLLDLIRFVIILCDLAAGTRCLYCLIRIIGDPDEAKAYGKKILNMLIFLILANTALALMSLIENYFA